MSMVTISADLPNLTTVLQRLDKANQPGGLPYTKEAVREATRDLIQRTWIQYASGQQVSYSGGTFRINVITGAYRRSIEDGLRFPDDMTGEVFSTSKVGAIIEDGQPARDMKPKMLASPKAKVGKDGKRYITVGFRHGTPGAVTMPAMPANVYNEAKNLGYSRRNADLLGGTRTYTWGGRYKGDATGQRSHSGSHPSAMVSPRKQGYTWKSGLYQGMVKMGRGRHTQYITFRRLSENSDPQSWMFPAVPPKRIREAVVENTREEVLQLIRQGFEMDLYFMGLGGD